MKTLIAFFFLALNVAVASEGSSFLVEGELQKVELNGKVVAQKLIALGHEFYLSSPEKGEDRECLGGVYEIAANDVEGQSFKLLHIHRCEGGANNMGLNKNIFCPAVYQPVCGIPTEGGAPRTYGNTCEMSRDGAKKLFDGACEKALNSLQIGAAINRFLTK
ncbi:MAG: hypothetical protein A2X86_11665 [Bdellovibrionales bacterium GWA2_49_15]|nr:MAG: hypothetical protein A2X86_11665 [Bdellovibrionales bacterium GWA2_49_15]HAZ12591.1 hypothetical protein [Bdellovibrionales bacterium]